MAASGLRHGCAMAEWRGVAGVAVWRRGVAWRAWRCGVAWRGGRGVAVRRKYTSTLVWGTLHPVLSRALSSTIQYGSEIIP